MATIINYLPPSSSARQKYEADVKRTETAFNLKPGTIEQANTSAQQKSSSKSRSSKSRTSTPSTQTPPMSVAPVSTPTSQPMSVATPTQTTAQQLQTQKGVSQVSKFENTFNVKPKQEGLRPTSQTTQPTETMMSRRPTFKERKEQQARENLRNQLKENIPTPITGTITEAKPSEFYGGEYYKQSPTESIKQSFSKLIKGDFKNVFEPFRLSESQKGDKTELEAMKETKFLGIFPALDVKNVRRDWTGAFTDKTTLKEKEVERLKVVETQQEQTRNVFVQREESLRKDVQSEIDQGGDYDRALYRYNKELNRINLEYGIAQQQTGNLSVNTRLFERSGATDKFLSTAETAGVVGATIITKNPQIATGYFLGKGITKGAKAKTKAEQQEATLYTALGLAGLPSMAYTQSKGIYQGELDTLASKKMQYEEIIFDIGGKKSNVLRGVQKSGGLTRTTDVYGTLTPNKFGSDVIVTTTGKFQSQLPFSFSSGSGTKFIGQSDTFSLAGQGSSVSIKDTIFGSESLPVQKPITSISTIFDLGKGGKARAIQTSTNIGGTTQGTLQTGLSSVSGDTTKSFGGRTLFKDGKAVGFQIESFGTTTTISLQGSSGFKSFIGGGKKSSGSFINELYSTTTTKTSSKNVFNFPTQQVFNQKDTQIASFKTTEQKSIYAGKGAYEQSFSTTRLIPPQGSMLVKPTTIQPQQVDTLFNVPDIKPVVSGLTRTRTRTRVKTGEFVNVLPVQKPSQRVDVLPIQDVTGRQDFKFGRVPSPFIPVRPIGGRGGKIDGFGIGGFGLPKFSLFDYGFKKGKGGRKNVKGQYLPDIGKFLGAGLTSTKQPKLYSKGVGALIRRPTVVKRRTKRR